MPEFLPTTNFLFFAPYIKIQAYLLYLKPLPTVFVEFLGFSVLVLVLRPICFS